MKKRRKPKRKAPLPKKRKRRKLPVPPKKRAKKPVPRKRRRKSAIRVSAIARALAKVGGGGGILRPEQLELLREGRKVMKDRGVQWVRRSGVPAQSPSMLRHVPGALSSLYDLNRAAGESGEDVNRRIAGIASDYRISIQEAFAKFKDMGMSAFSARFRRKARELSNLYEVPLREVYTLWFSP